CWETIHDYKKGPCEFCTNDKLVDGDGNPAKAHIWEIYNQKTKKWYHLNDQAIPWIDGRLVRMEIAIDITERKQSEKKLVEINKTLDKRVKDRTNKLKLLNDYLVRSEEQIRKAAALDLHDSVAQNLALSIFQLKNMREPGTQVNLENIIEIEKSLEQSVKVVRSLIYQLSPPFLDDFEIDMALKALIEEYNDNYQTDISYIKNTNSSLFMSQTVKVTLYRSVNELIVNMIKHSGSKKAEIELTENKNDILLRVEDHGAGFDLNKLKNKNSYGFGIQSISERINSLGGRIEFFSQPGKGMKILILVSKTS
ncbi:MAG: hypothetical protein KOO65_07415, partial [Desulfobacterales bacterium]|nr:hypothetical protein [Desulfobacterales bacterium]